jgi:BirA family biotin operon repressor/biotin-[acetyl-CoA-carboxylase] ligase
MSESYIPLDVDFIKANLNTSRIGKEIIIYKSTSSTNDIAAEYAKGGKKNDGLAVFAESQTAGRGRRGNKWQSGDGKSILCSILLYEPDIRPDTLTLACAVAAAESIGRCGRNDAKIKWPNDILLNDKKVAGILVEASATKNKKKYYIAGIGINCHQKKEDFSDELSRTATSIDIQSGGICDRNRIAKRLLINLDHYVTGGLENTGEIVEKWRSMSILLGKRITVEHNGRKFTGNCIGIEPIEGLVLQLERGGVKMFDAASTTVVKIELTEIDNG